MPAQESMTTRTIFMESENGDRGSVKYLCKIYSLNYSSVYARVRKVYDYMNNAPDEAISEAMGINVWRVEMTDAERDAMADPRRLGLERQRKVRKRSIHWMMTKPLTRSGGVHRPYY